MVYKGVPLRTQKGQPHLLAVIIAPPILPICKINIFSKDIIGTICPMAELSWMPASISFCGNAPIGLPKFNPGPIWVLLSWLAPFLT